jgi:hypothetical protein
MDKRFSLKRVFVFTICLATPSMTVYIGAGDILRMSDQALNLIGLTFSILAAALFATVSIIGDPSMLLTGSWRTAWRSAQTIQIRILRLIYLFILYMIVLFLLVLAAMAKYIDPYLPKIVFNFLAFFSTLAFCISLWLPFELKEIQLTRLEHEIEARRSGTPRPERS